MVRPDLNVLGALTRLQNSRDWALVLDWLRTRREAALNTCGAALDVDTIRQAQGRNLELQELLEQATSADTDFAAESELAKKRAQARGPVVGPG